MNDIRIIEYVVVRDEIREGDCCWDPFLVLSGHKIVLY